MFLENEYARPLFDFEKGGKPSAYICLMLECEIPENCNKRNETPVKRCQHKRCKKVTRTERGMRMHLKQVHGWEEQECLYSIDNQNSHQKNPERKLRMFSKQNIEATTKRSLTTVTEPDHVAQVEQLPLTEPKMNVEPSLKPTNEEK